MRVLFVHQNFPAQFRHIAASLAADHGWPCDFCTERADTDLPGVRKILYKPRGGATLANSVLTRNYENAVAHAVGVFEAMKACRDARPDLIVAHSGFGSSLFLPFLFDAPIINFFELFYRPSGQDLGYRPERPVGEGELLRTVTNNAMILLDAVNCDRGWTPTNYQRDFFPPELRPKIEVLFDGIDTRLYRRRDGARQRINAAFNVDPSHRLVTYAARGFEMIRGFDIFMKASDIICRNRPDVTFLAVGSDKVYYGGDLKYFKEDTFRHHVLNQGNYDLSRFRFPGFVPAETLADILSASDVHLYLTEPFVTSWSMLGAMACGAVVIASDQTCVREYIDPRRTGLLVDFFDHESLARQTLSVLSDPASHRSLGDAAAVVVAEKYSLEVSLPPLKRFFETTAAAPRRQSQLLETLLKPGTLPILITDPMELARKARLTDAPPQK
jgi:glycosyltransferase involved in cell wall biosynthesis